MRAQLRESSAGGSEPKIAFAIFADGSNIVRPAQLAENDRLKAIVVEAKQASSARPNPEAAIVALAQTPDAHRACFVSSKVIEAFVIGEIDQVSVAEGPQVAAAIFINSKILRTASLAVGLQSVGNQMPVNKTAHPGARCDPDCARTSDMYTRHEVVGKAIARGE